MRALIEQFRSSPPKEKAFVVLLAAASAWLFAYHIVHKPFAVEGVDFVKHYEAAKAMLAGYSPYYEASPTHGYVYPVFVSLFHFPLGWFETRAGAEAAWDAANIAIVLFCAAVLGRALRPGPGAGGTAPGEFLHRWWGLVVFFFLASYDPLHVVLSVANVEPWNLLFGSLFVACFVRRRDHWAGVFLAAFALVKVGPAFLLLGVLALRRWRVAGAFAAFIAAYLLFLLATGWWREESTVYTERLPALPHYWQGISLSIHRLLAELRAPHLLAEGQQAAYAAFVFRVNILLGGAYAALCAWQFLRRGADEELFLAYAFFAVLVLSPLVEGTHFTWVAPAIALQLRAWGRGVLGPSALVLLVGLWCGVSMLHTLLGVASGPFGWPGWRFQTLVLAYCLVASAAAAFLAVRPAIRPEPDPDA